MSGLQDAALSLLDDLAKKKLKEIKDPKIRGYLTDVWGGLKDEAPALFETLVGPGEVVLSGKYAEETKRILAELQEDVLAFKRKEFGNTAFEELVWRRKRAIFALYSAQKWSQKKINADKVLKAAETITGILVKYGIPFILAML